MAAANPATKSKPATKSDAVGPKDKPAAKKDMSETKTDKTDKSATEPAASATDKSTDAKDDHATGYSRGEGQKTVSPRYRNNWDQVFGKKKKK